MRFLSFSERMVNISKIIQIYCRQDTLDPLKPNNRVVVHFEEGNFLSEEFRSVDIMTQRYNEIVSIVQEVKNEQ